MCIRDRQQPALSLDLGIFPYCSDLANDKMVVGCQGEKILVLHLPNLQKYTDPKNRTLVDSHLGVGSQITNIAVQEFPGYKGGTLVGMGTNDGRANISKIDNETQYLSLIHI
eukprot:TRINITY_DN6682_c0_g1_i4.p3 TRINITY_DN6682_c0_g1~~TRINITY_DN6682_c0_g1_i4.p3  ORF type:complete len:112 (+),score=21.68 TRINITY_DN6682_c0_g1_i4:61-396(+)